MTLCLTQYSYFLERYYLSYIPLYVEEEISFLKYYGTIDKDG